MIREISILTMPPPSSKTNCKKAIDNFQELKLKIISYLLYRCIPCPDGEYIDPKSQMCQSCPAGTVLPSSNSWGRESCKPCGPGLHPVGGRSCKSDCHFTDDLGREYDFTELDT